MLLALDRLRRAQRIHARNAGLSSGVIPERWPGRASGLGNPGGPFEPICESATATTEPDPRWQRLAERQTEDVVAGMDIKHVRPATPHPGRDGKRNRSVASRPEMEPSRTRATVGEAGAARHFDA